MTTDPSGAQALYPPVIGWSTQVYPMPDVNAVAPDPILATDGLDATEAAEVVQDTPPGRWGGEEEIVKAVVLLVETDFITGETIRVDGGHHLR